jgi:hypothetical protein
MASRLQCDRNRCGGTAFHGPQIRKIADCLGSDNVKNDIIAWWLVID